MGAHCHALRVRLTQSGLPEVLGNRLAAMASTRLWVDDVSGTAAGQIAERRRTAEMSRPAERLRCVLLRYADDRADLVIVAHRGFLAREALRRFAAGLIGALPDLEPAQPPGKVRPLPAASAAAPPVWGFGAGHSGHATHEISCDTEGDTTSWLTALAVTVSRYEASGEAGGTVAIGTDDGTVELSVRGTLDETRWQPFTPTDRPPVVGIVFEPDVDGDEYVPYLAPPCPLTISVGTTGTGPTRLRCDHLPSHVEPAVAARFVRQVARVHRQVVWSPELPVAQAVLLDDRERAELVALGRSPEPPPDAECSVPAAFSRVATATPTAVALCDGETRYTYGELDERATRLANGLTSIGVRSGDFVGVCLERSAELVVTLLGVLKAGAAYVPIDPSYPPARLAHTVRDAGLDVVVTRLPEFPAADGTRVLTVDELAALARPCPPTEGVGREHPAYVIYTSGSTGRPKGVVVPHRNVLSLVAATRDPYRLGSGDVWSLFHSSAFDFSVWEMWGCLLTGGRLVVVPYQVSRDPDRFRDLLAGEQVTVLSQTPSAFAQLLSVDHTDLDVRLVVFGGEPLNARMLLPWFDRHDECQVVNMYGITETTVHVTARTVTRESALTSSRSVGRALPGWRVYVLDDAGLLVPPGVAGEICVAGAGVAQCYLGRPELTAERFVPDPFAGGRMYRSGDLGRWHPDGTLEHLGRLDNQVKIRGFRVELDEIQAVLLADADVRAAAVALRRDDPDDAATARLDAYVVLSSGNTGAVRKRAAAVLPEYMVPATVTAVSEIPLTVNGKLDLTALPVPARPEPEGPRTTDEGLAAQLRAVWADVLGVPVGVDDDFFELGGNSLYAVRIGAAMRERGLPPIQLRELYLRPTIRAVVEVAGVRGGGR